MVKRRGGRVRRRALGQAALYGCPIDSLAPACIGKPLSYLPTVEGTGTCASSDVRAELVLQSMQPRPATPCLCRSRRIRTFADSGEPSAAEHRNACNETESRKGPSYSALACWPLRRRRHQSQTRQGWENIAGWWRSLTCRPPPAAAEAQPGVPPWSRAPSCRLGSALRKPCLGSDILP